MKTLKGWDTYVQNAKSTKDSTLLLPITENESYRIPYPTRSRGRKIKRAQEQYDTDALLVALLGEKAGERVIELSEDQPVEVVDNLIIDVLRAFGFLSDEPDEETLSADTDVEAEASEGKEPDSSGVEQPNSPVASTT